MATCKDCEFEIDTEDFEEGDDVICPECGKQFTMGGDDELEPADDDEDDLDDDEDEDLEDEDDDDEDDDEDDEDAEDLDD